MNTTYFTTTPTILRTESLAKMLNGRPAGKGKWYACCPAHKDHSPSLSICEGRDGRVLLRCFAGCDTSAILSSLGLSWSAICGKPLSQEEATQAALQRQQRDAEARKVRQKRGVLADRYRRLQDIADALASKMASTPDTSGDALAELYHDTLGKLRSIEAAWTKEAA